MLLANVLGWLVLTLLQLLVHGLVVWVGLHVIVQGADSELRATHQSIRLMAANYWFCT